jgi:hypothetical protein
MPKEEGGILCNSAALEHELQRKLNRTWAALIVKCTSRPEALVEHFDRLPEKQVRQVGIDISEIWMVQDIKCLGF